MKATLPEDLKLIESPHIENHKPDCLTDCVFIRQTQAYSFGWPVELYRHPDGRCIESTSANTAFRRYKVYSSLRAWEIANLSHAARDPEGRGGRFFPSDYRRLKITKTEVKSEDSFTGWRHSPACTCFSCGEEVLFYKTRYAHSDAEGYIPFCESCYSEVEKDATNV